MPKKRRSSTCKAEADARRKRARRAQETEKEREQRLANMRVREAQSRARETDEEREQRLAYMRMSRAQSRARETAKRKLVWANAASSYQPRIDYTTLNVLSGKMNKVCNYFNARKWPGEAPGICCSGGNVRLAGIKEPPDVLKKLLLEYMPRAVSFKSKDHHLETWTVSGEAITNVYKISDPGIAQVHC